MRAVAMATAVALAIGCSCPDQYQPGAVIVSGDSTEALAKGNGLFFAIHGSERVSDTELRDVTVLHGLVLPPPVDIRGSGGGFKRDCLIARENFTWKLGHWKNGPFDLPDQKLTVHFDGRTREAIVGTQRFDTRKGNLLIIRLDASWQPTTSQLAASGDGRQGLAELRREFPEVPEIQEARLYNEEDK